MSRLLPIVLLFALTAAGAQPATRAEVAAQRAAIEGQFTRDAAECEKRFSVAACLDELRQRRNDALAPLVRREHELAAEERRERAAAQVQRVRERELAAAQDEGQRRERIVMAPAPSLPSTPASHSLRGRSPDDAAQARRQAERKAEVEAAKRREQARERELRQQQRVAAHEAKEKRRMKPLAAPLPLPGAGLGGRRACVVSLQAGLTRQSRFSTLTMASERLSPPPRARWRALLTSSSAASRGGRLYSTLPSSCAVK